MKARELKALLVLIIVSVNLTGFACASNRVNLLKDETYKLKTISSRGYKISNVHVYKLEDGLEITGKLKRHSRSFGIGGGHIDIAIVSPEGEVLEKLSTTYVPRMIPAKRMHRREARFKVCVPTIPPMGSKFRVAYHRDSKTVNRKLSCGENRAASNI